MCGHEFHPQTKPSITSDSHGPAGMGTVLEYKAHRGDGAPRAEEFFNDFNRIPSLALDVSTLVAKNWR